MGLRPAKKLLVVLSGGMDSAVVLTLAHREHGPKNVIALTFDYGQRHKKEMEAAEALASYFQVKHIIHKMDLRQIGGSSLTDSTIAVPEFEKDADVWEKTGSALTYVPMRNTIFLAIAAAYAETLGCDGITFGANWMDSGGYPDTRPEYVDAMNIVMQTGSRDKPQILAPLIFMTKKQIVQEGMKHGTPWHLTWSCYEGNATPCGKCNACVQRKKGFTEAGIRDPVEG